MTRDARDSRLTIPQFQARWRTAAGRLNERQAAQSHFNDLCDLFGVTKPADADPEEYAFEKGADKLGGGKGYADVWRTGYFAWEYKGAHADLDKAYGQLQLYRDFLDNPPLLVVSDLVSFRVYTNFTNTKQEIHRFTLDDLDQPAVWDILRRVFLDPNSLRPGASREDVTKEAAARFGELAGSLQARGEAAPVVAHFLMQCLFCLFAEDAGLLPKGLFTNLLGFGARRPDRFAPEADALFTAMAEGGSFALQDVPHFNGGLFAGTEGREDGGTEGPGGEGELPLSRARERGLGGEGQSAALDLTADQLGTLAKAAALDWANVEPAIFGTLFERSLDPGSRAQLGAHYTGRADIERVVEPVLMTPLRRRWAAVRAEADGLKTAWDEAEAARRQGGQAARTTRARNAFAAKVAGFQEELRAVRVLDPACGSGNFLYVALAKLLDLEKEVLAYGAANGLPLGYPVVGPDQLLGLEINEYARELAQVVVWIGYLQWMIGNGFTGLSEPILKPLDTIRRQDALLDRSDPAHPREAAWPAADAIVGNPPFVGDKKMRGELGGEYTDTLWRVFRDRVPPGADLVCYFFEKARSQIAEEFARRAGLLSTNSIRGGANRRVLDRIKASGDIFMAWNDEPWVLDGADVRISIVGFDDGSESERILDGKPVATINADLTASINVTTAKRLPENATIAFLGVQKGGPFDVSGETARQWLTLPANPNGRPNSDVVKPRLNGSDIMRRSQANWIMDFGPEMQHNEAAFYEASFEHVLTHVKPLRATNPRKAYREKWWIHTEPRQGLRAKIACLDRFICTPTVAKHRVFVWTDKSVVPDHQLIVFAREDDYFFGVLQSRVHEVWSLRMGTWLGVGNDPRYTPTTCFETFPLPWPPGREPDPAADPRVAAIADAAKALDAARRRWLNPPDITEAELKKRTLTNLYNARPTWLGHLHAALDRAVWAAYGWDDDPATTTDEEFLARLLALNGVRAGVEDGGR